jgi:hypothetical protein
VTEVPSLPAVWQKSTFSNLNGCVEVADLGDGTIAVRNSKRPEAGHVVFTRHEIDAFVQGVVAGEFDRFR